MIANYPQLLRSKILPRVQSPGQYTGGELNMTVKDPANMAGRFCLCFPDTYAIGMSCHGIQVLYHVMNQMDDFYCERAFAPMRDMEALLRQEGLPLGSLETSTPLAEFDAVGFSLQHELGYSNVLTMLDLGGIPLHGEQRKDSDPLVLAGGPCVQNPEPMADFIDAFILGDGEESLPEVNREWVAMKKSGLSRAEKLEHLARRFPWLYVPSCYATREENGLWIPYPKHAGIPEKITQAVVMKLDDYPLPDRPVVPNVEAVQDRIAIEIMRGCPWSCRFCQSNPIRRPVRSRKVETVLNNAIEAVKNTGYSEISLLSLSTSDYPWFGELMGKLREVMDCQNVSLSVPSLRVNEHLAQVGEALSTERHSGLTLAPEAALDDMRAVIGKRVTNDDLMAGCRIAFENGFQRVKLYCMFGLPGERQKDIDGMVELADAIGRLGKDVTGRFPTVVVSASNLVPKPQTPLQWCAMAPREYLLSAQRYLKRRRLPKSIQIKYHFVEGSLLEGVFCRGDRRVGAVIERAWRDGARFDSWSDQFFPDRWWAAFEACGVDPEPYLHRAYSPEMRLPWSLIEIRQGVDYLEREYRDAMRLVAEMGGSTTFTPIPTPEPPRWRKERS
ncbi:MAG: TIGR03960 family B12-binding radical SAM protein [Planctomycetia bacterium]|nr:TIGR03960 family B12-binding radical SAM protein [Planctomycetia bacterium]